METEVSATRPQGPASYFRVPSLIVTGFGAAKHTSEVLNRLGVGDIVVVTDRNLLSVVSPIVTMLQEGGRVRGVYDSVVSEPTSTHVEEIVRLLNDTEATGLVAIGGGSVIDAAKAAAAMVRHPGSIADYQGYDRFAQPPLPLVALPTTGGTGSEATRVVVITDLDQQVKMMLMADQLMASGAIVDPDLMRSCPPSVTASAGIDALTHSIEAYISRKAHPMTDVLALAACHGISRSLRRAFDSGNDMGARAQIALGALQAGMAFSNSSVALVHGMSRPLGALFGVPHGIANAMLLPAVMRFSMEGAVGRYADIGEAMGVADPSASDTDRALSAVAEVEALNHDLLIPSLSQYGINRHDFQDALGKMASDAIDSGSPANNPIVPSETQIIELYMASY